MSAITNGKMMAYPCDLGETWSLGLSKRELFAAMMMEGLITHGKVPMGKQDVAAVAVQYADSLLAELEKKP